MPLPSSSEPGLGSRIIDRREIMVTLAGLLIVVITLILGRVGATVVLITSTGESIPFSDVEATFSVRIPTAGIVGVLFDASPVNACEPVRNVYQRSSSLSAFLLVERGGCNFVTKVQHAQDAGYAAAIIYDNVETHDLVTMSGSGAGIQIHAVFVSKQAGDVLQPYVGDLNSRCYMFPSFENPAWSVMAVSFISLLAVSAILSTFFFVRRHRLRQLGLRLLSRESAGISHLEVKELPVILFSGGCTVTTETCAICLEEYEFGEKLRIMPCRHEFHVACIDQWLTTRRPFCPICKQDVRCKNVDSLPTERTPLLSCLRRHLGSTAASIPVANQASPGTSSVQSPSDCSESFSMVPHAFHPLHTLSCPIPLSSRVQEDGASTPNSTTDTHNMRSSLHNLSLLAQGNVQHNECDGSHVADLC